jgi:hypothetical protein
LHELAHVERYDYGFNAVANLAQSVWFFLPHTWWLRSRLMIDQEFLADQSAARRYGASSQYAAALLSMAADASPEPRDSLVASATSAPAIGKPDVPSALFQRILMLLHCPFPIETRTPRLWSWTWNLAVLATLVLATCLVIRWPDLEPPGASSSTQTSPAANRFHIARFVAEPHPGAPNGRSFAYLMPLPLPQRFDLDVEVCSTPNGLDQIRIAGYPLKNVPPLPLTHAPILASRSPDGKSWRHVHVHRDHESVTVEIDGQPLSDEPMPEVVSEYLTIEPGPQGPAEFRDLTVSW